jgi:hypothetical protein
VSGVIPETDPIDTRLQIDRHFACHGDERSGKGPGRRWGDWQCVRRARQPRHAIVHVAAAAATVRRVVTNSPPSVLQPRSREREPSFLPAVAGCKQTATWIAANRRDESLIVGGRSCPFECGDSHIARNLRTGKCAGASCVFRMKASRCESWLLEKCSEQERMRQRAHRRERRVFPTGGDAAPAGPPVRPKN